MLHAKLKGQSTLEYVILLGFVVAALIAMGVYMKRGAQGQLRRSADQVGEQYEAGETTGKYTESTDVYQDEHIGVDTAGHIETTVIRDNRGKSGSETVIAMPTTQNTITP